MFFEKRKNVIKLLNLKLDEVSRWNQQAFKNATLAGQLAKLEEEMRKCENTDAESEGLQLADIFIVIGGLRRFNSLIGQEMFEAYVKKAKTKDIETLIESIDKKMKINRKRSKRWVWKQMPDGSYHH